MKSLKSIILCGLGVALLSLVSCSDVLDTDPYDQFTKDNYFTSENNVQLFANYFYNTLWRCASLHGYHTVLAAAV